MLEKLLVTWQGDRDRLCLRHHWPQKDTWHLCHRDNPVGLGVCGMIIYGHSMSQLTLMDRLRCRPPVSCTLSEATRHAMICHALDIENTALPQWWAGSLFPKRLLLSISEMFGCSEVAFANLPGNELQLFRQPQLGCKTFDIDWFCGEVNSAQALGTDNTGTFRMWSKLTWSSNGLKSFSLPTAQWVLLLIQLCTIMESCTWHIHISMHMYIYTHAHTHTYIHTYIYIYRVTTFKYTDF